jgi:transcriptional regulator with XRE-family HTH domain
MHDFYGVFKYNTEKRIYLGARHEMIDRIGLKIRKERKNRDLTLKELAEKVGISTMTLQRIETGKTSPSVSVLAQISSHLRQSMDYFIQEKQPKITVIKKKDQPTARSTGMSLRAVVPLEMTDKKLLVNLGEGKSGRFIDPHTENGHSLVYVLAGKATLQHDGVEYHLDEGDAVYYDARYLHSVKATNKKHKFLSIFFKED